MDTNTLLVVLIVILIGLILFLIYRMNSLNQLKNRIDTIEDKTNKQNESDISLNEKMNQVGQALNELLKESNQSQMNINNIFDKVNDMNNVMVNKKSRGNFGEYQLDNLLSIYCGESTEIYETQYLLKNGYIGDVALHMPNSDKVLIIDSKFPAENFERLSDENISEVEQQKYKSQFRQDIKKHINDIARKYITKETSENAVMFIPSEAIYYYICKECDELITYAYSKHVLMTSPTTLLGVVFTFIDITKDINRTKNIKALEKDIVNMYDDALRLADRVDTVNKTLEKLEGNVKNVSISTNKIVNRIERIHDGYSEEE